MAVKLSLKDENVYEGEIFAVDPVTSTVVMQCGEEYKIVFGDQVTKIDGAMTANCAPGVPPSLVRYISHPCIPQLSIPMEHLMVPFLL